MPLGALFGGVSPPQLVRKELSGFLPAEQGFSVRVHPAQFVGGYNWVRLSQALDPGPGSPVSIVGGFSPEPLVSP